MKEATTPPKEVQVPDFKRPQVTLVAVGKNATSARSMYWSRSMGKHTITASHAKRAMASDTERTDYDTVHGMPELQ